MIRLGFGERIRSSIGVDESLPAGGQGAVGIECRTGDSEAHALLSCLNHAPTATRVVAERALNKRLNGGCRCRSPVMRCSKASSCGCVGWSGSRTVLCYCAPKVAPAAEAEVLGVQVAEELLGQGAEQILKAVYGEAGHA